MRVAARRLLMLELLLLLVFASAFAFASAPPSAKALESRLYAPCCYGGTLDIHDSDLARDLRKEIEGRLAGGETTASIQNDFVSRYGDKVVAARSERPIELMTLGLGAGFVAAAIASLLALRRWLARGRELRAVAVSHPQAKRDDYDGKLDEALANLDAE